MSLEGNWLKLTNNKIFLSENMIKNIEIFLNKNNLFKNYEKFIKNIDKNSDKYKVWLFQILINIYFTSNWQKQKIIKIDGIISDIFLKNIKEIYPKFSSFTDYSANAILRIISSPKTVNQIEITKSENKIFQNDIEDKNWINKLSFEISKKFLTKIVNNNTSKSKFINYLKRHNKNISDLQTDMTLSEKIAILQVYISQIDQNKRNEDAKLWKYVFTSYYETHKIKDINWIFDSNTIYILNYLLDDFDNTITDKSIIKLLSFNFPNTENAKSHDDKITTKVEKTKIVINKKNRKDALYQNRESYVNKKIANRILDFMDEPIFLRCYNYLNKDLWFDEATTSAICGNIFVESWFDAMVKWDNGSAHGLCQWRNDRRKALQNFARSKWWVNKRSIQLQFIKRELNNEYIHVLKKMNQTKNVFEKTKIFMSWYEIPNTKPNINHISHRKWFSGSAFATL